MSSTTSDEKTEPKRQQLLDMEELQASIPLTLKELRTKNSRLFEDVLPLVASGVYDQLKAFKARSQATCPDLKADHLTHFINIALAKIDADVAVARRLIQKRLRGHRPDAREAASMIDKEIKKWELLGRKLTETVTECKGAEEVTCHAEDGEEAELQEQQLDSSELGADDYDAVLRVRQALFYNFIGASREERDAAAESNLGASGMVDLQTSAGRSLAQALLLNWSRGIF
ncbi:uncharacterized protein HMPREF1541_09614 [Cyphellophora europaea CBS 101466]|uniref:Uncharacterized protein n=1 Tax=Cyphellophora europaea (strain CBS 101466) TaxID=1220924 RepID=W2SAN1_CYPE1|nr:uncharacterized protein HMPREF1541_09614 [Cyphellophora europaea CBS 101466]ETN45781.1 hypothetical protein HMPREF1541_09614 [Cyphellophora europaea CBS 101466]